MSEHVWEQAVALWLTRDRGVFVSPSYGLGPEGKWACLDFLALDFKERVIWAIEVTTGAHANRIKRKAAEFVPQYQDRIGAVLEQVGVSPVLDLRESWKIGLWAFVRDDLVGDMKRKLEPLPCPTCVTSLEKIAIPWKKDWWQDRFR